MRKIAMLLISLGLAVGASAASFTGKVQAKKGIFEQLTAPVGSANISVSTDVYSTHDIQAATFHGDGSALTGVIHSSDTVVGDETTIHKSGQTFSALSSSVTLQGNSFNGANQLNKLDNSGYLVGDGRNLSNLPGQNGHGSFSGSNYALGVGTFSYTTLGIARTVGRITVTIAAAGELGSTGTVWCCGATGLGLCVTTTAGLAEGSSATQSGSGAVGAADLFALWMQSSDEAVTPTANVVCEYQ